MYVTSPYWSKYISQRMGFVFRCFDIDMYSIIERPGLNLDADGQEEGIYLCLGSWNFITTKMGGTGVLPSSHCGSVRLFGSVSPKLSIHSRSNAVSMTPRLEEQANNLRGCFLSRLSNSDEDGNWRRKRTYDYKKTCFTSSFPSPQGRLSL